MIIYSFGELKQDEWSLSKPRFGDKGQLEVIGWEYKRNTNKIYILICKECAKDPELNGNGYCKASKRSLEIGNLPCNCSLSPKRDRRQTEIVCKRKAEELGYKFVRFDGDWKGARTKITLNCHEHGDWSGSSVNNLLRDRKCPACSERDHGSFLRKPDEDLIQSFKNSGSFPEGTLFWRDESRDDGTDSRLYWFIYCPLCQETARSLSCNLIRGKISCACSPHKQKEGYINEILNDQGLAIALKFGIARDSDRRLAQQNSRSKYEVKRLVRYLFPDVMSCKSAEKQCRKLIDRGVLSKEDFPDGWTETTDISNFDKIVEVYLRLGGVEMTGTEGEQP